MLFIRSIFVALLCLAISACATNPTDSHKTSTSIALNQQHLASLVDIQSFNIKGRIGVQTEQKGFSGGLSWQHLRNIDSSTKDSIALYSPLGGQVASIEKTPENVTLTDQKGVSVSAQSAEILTQTTLGWQLPLSGLADWSLGRPTQSPIKASSWDEMGRLLTLEQDGWRIEYANYAIFEGKQLPNKVSLFSDKVNLKLIIERLELEKMSQ